jgi:hypothetical protein
MSATWQLAPEAYFAILADNEVCGAGAAADLSHWVTVWDAVTSACFSPANRIDEQDIFPSLCEKAAVLGWRLLDLGLPSAEWKVRAARLSMLEFVQRNGGEWIDVDNTAALQTAVILSDAMVRRVSLAEFTYWVCAQIQ